METQEVAKRPWKKWYTLLIIGLVILGILTGSVIWYFVKGSKVPTTYPYVFVHGLNGWGESADGAISYWGATSGKLLPQLREQGYECHAPTVGPMSSAWDRACELYAQLTGTRVDYGAAHAKEYGHERYGDTYTNAMVPTWGQEDEDGNLRKINLIGHSFGGATIRLFSQLLAEGSTQEQAASPTDCSPLFLGGKGDWVYSLTALAAPHNGTTLLYAVGDGTGIINTLMKAVGSFTDSGLVKTFLDQMESMGLSFSTQTASHDFEELVRLSGTKDNAYYDLTLQGADEVNALITANPELYYFSYPFDGTRDSLLGSTRVGSSDMMLLLQPIASIIGAYKNNKQSSHVLDDSWLPNDGLVNTISAMAPAKETKVDYDESNIQKGVWNVMPTMRGDHGKSIGLMQEQEWTLKFYLEQMYRIDMMSLAETGGDSIPTTFDYSAMTTTTEAASSTTSTTAQ